MSLFKKFLDANRDLDVNTLAIYGFTSKLALSWIDRDEMLRIINLINPEFLPMSFFHSEWGKNDLEDKCYSINEFMDKWIMYFPEDLVIEIFKDKFYIWFKAGENFAVIFGTPTLVNKIKGDGYSRGFIDEYIDDYRPSTKEDETRIKNFLVKLADKYNMDATSMSG